MRKELFGALLLWVLNELLGRAFLHHHAAIHEQDAVGHVTGKVHLVGDDDHGGLAVGKVAQDAQHLAGQLRVEGRGRLVEAENVRVQSQCAGNGHALLLTAGKLVRVVACPGRKAHLGQKFLCLLFQLGMDGLFVSLVVRTLLCQQFTRQHNQPTHYYFVWTRLISYYTKYSKYTLAQYELERFLDQAIRDDYKPAIAGAYKHLGHIYRTKSLYNTAIDTYLKAIDVAERNGLKEVDVSDLYLQLGEMYTQQRKYDQSERALRMAEKTILLPEHIWRVRIAQANLHAEEGEFARARQLLREIRDGSNGYASENKVREIELSIYKHSGELHKALEIVNKQLAPYEKTRDSTHYFYIPMLGTRAAINYELGNYKASAEDLSRQMALAQKKYDQSNRETLNEFATLFDVERLDREKA